MAKTFVFTAKMLSGLGETVKGVSSEFAISGDESLYKLSKAIVKSFGFAFDHTFGFVTDDDVWHSAGDSYTIFFDLNKDDDSIEPFNEKDHGVRGVKIKDIFAAGKSMYFWFDTGDEWQFLIKCTNDNDAKKHDSLPEMISIEGLPPAQYSPSMYDCFNDFDDEDK
jgi:hypothetical protein